MRTLTKHKHKHTQTVHRKLRLQHYSHTGRVLHHRHTSYHGLVVVLVLAVAVMVGLNVMARATADTITVYARNPARIPTEPSVITSPSDGTIISKAKLLVSGTCPDMTPGVIIVITDNGDASGSVPCSGGSFSISIAISTTGHHTLVAKTYTITNDTGPDSDPVGITRILPPGQAGATDLLDNLAGNGSPLVVTIDTPFIVFGPVSDAVWLGTITGGTLPYQVHMDWGDGATNDYKVTTKGEQRFTRHYRSMKPHVIVMQVTDAAHRAVLKNYAAVTPYTPPYLFAAPTAPWNGSLPLGLYGAYLLLLVVFGGLWARAHPVTYALVPVRTRRNAPSPRHKATGRR